MPSKRKATAKSAAVEAAARRPVARPIPRKGGGPLGIAIGVVGFTVFIALTALSFYLYQQEQQKWEEKLAEKKDELQAVLTKLESAGKVDPSEVADLKAASTAAQKKYNRFKLEEAALDKQIAALEEENKRLMMQISEMGAHRAEELGSEEYRQLVRDVEALEKKVASGRRHVQRRKEAIKDELNAAMERGSVTKFMTLYKNFPETPYSSAMAFFAAEGLLEKGDYNRARSWYARINENFPGSPYARVVNWRMAQLQDESDRTYPELSVPMLTNDDVLPQGTLPEGAGEGETLEVDVTPN